MNIIEIAKKIENIGGKLYLVGGSVRDEIMGRQKHDEDYCIVGVSFDAFLNAFPEAKTRGKSFPVFDLEGKEFALARIEKKTGKGHKEFEVEANKEITIEQDLARRDITINSIAKDVLTGEIRDPFQGVKDIEKKIIKATTESFKEDPLRVYRVARMASELGFQVDENTMRLMNELKKELNTLSKERVFEEFKKALKTEKPSLFFETLKKANVLEIHFEEIYKLIGAIQPPKYHPEGDSYIHTMEVLDRVAVMTEDIAIRFGGLVHDLGKGVTPKEEYPHHYGHDKNGIEEVKKLCKRLGLPIHWEKCGITSAKEHMLGGIFFNMKAEKQVSFIERVNHSALGLKGLQMIVSADKKDRKEIIGFYKIAQGCITEINGCYIKKKYGMMEKEGMKWKELLHKERVIWMSTCNKNVIFK